MEENKINEIKNYDSEKYQNIKKSLETLKNNKSKFLFVVTNTPNPAASIYEIYFHATVLKKLGYSTYILTDSPEYEIPYWIESELVEHEHISITEIKIDVGPADVLVIPEIFSNVMEQTKKLPCIRIGLLQSIDYMINALLPATDWASFGIQNVLTTSETLKNMFLNYFGSNYTIKVFKPCIPDYFNDTDTLKRPVISIVGRNPNEISKVVKLFYARFPQYTWIGFDSMITESKPPRPLNRKHYAERLKTNFASVWVDRIASFGTFPLEAMKAGNIPIGIVPDIIPEYLVETDENGQMIFAENSGVWTNDIYNIPQMIGETVTKFLDDSVDEKLYEKMKQIASKYSEKASAEEVQLAYTSFLNERAELFEKAIAEYEENVVEETQEK